MQPTEREPNNFCQVPGQKCYMNYCDENGCQDRKRRYTALGMSRLNNADLLAQLLKNQEDKEQVELAVAEITERLATARPTAPAATAEAGWLPLYPACKLPAVGERVALLNNYGRAALLAPRWGHLEQCIDGYVWRIDGDSAAWDFANFTHYLPIPARPTTEATIIRHLQA